jgi:hypothetical protein
MKIFDPRIPDQERAFHVEVALHAVLYGSVFVTTDNDGCIVLLEPDDYTISLSDEARSRLAAVHDPWDELLRNSGGSVKLSQPLFFTMGHRKSRR